MPPSAIGIRTTAVGIVVVVLATTACGGSSNDPASQTARSDSVAGENQTGTFTEVEMAYGLPPSRDADITYQPDVVFVGGGASAVRSVSDDGLVWTIDGDAENLSAVEPGTVMFLTTRAVGRVLATVERGDDLDVLLGPVDLTDVFLDATLSLDLPLDAGAVSFQHVPGLPGSLVETGSPDDPLVPDDTATQPGGESGEDSGEASAIPTMQLPQAQLVAARSAALPPPPIANGMQVAAARSGALPPPSGSANVQLTLGPLIVEPNVSFDQAGALSKISLRVGLGRSGNGLGGLAGSAEFTVTLDRPSLKQSTVIRNGEIVSGSAEINGIRQIDVKIDAGSADGTNSNVKFRGEVPYDMYVPVGGPFPFVMVLRHKFLLETALTAKNATISASGSYGVDGPLAMDLKTGEVTSQPTLSVRSSIMDSLKGVSIGVDGVVFAYQFRVQGGIGGPAFVAGPYLGLTASVGVTLGSAIGLTRCRGAAIDVSMTGGFGFVVDTAALRTLFDGLSFMFRVFEDRRVLPDMKLESDWLHRNVPLWHRDQTLPDVPLCTG